jgi:hypothetical protein
MTQDNETQGQEFFGDEDATDEEDDDSYEWGLSQLGEEFESMYISEKRLAGISDEENNVISPGSRTICHAMATIATSQENANHHQLQVKVKLDSWIGFHRPLGSFNTT